MRAVRLLPQTGEARAYLTLRLPLVLVLVQVVVMAMGAVDAAMVGHLSSQALVALGPSLNANARRCGYKSSNPGRPTQVTRCRGAQGREA